MVDIRRIDELRSEIGEADMLAVMQVFRDEAGERIATLTRPMSEADYAKAIHFLRSGAINLGLQSLADQAGAAASLPSADRAEAARRLSEILRRSASLIGLPDEVA